MHQIPDTLSTVIRQEHQPVTLFSSYKTNLGQPCQRHTHTLPMTVWQGEGHHTGRQDAGQSHHWHPVETLLMLIYLNFIFCKSFSSSLTFSKKKFKVDGDRSQASQRLSVGECPVAIASLHTAGTDQYPEMSRMRTPRSEAPELGSISPAFGFSPCSPSLCRYFNVNRENKLSLPIFEECISIRPCDPRTPPRSLYHRLL